MHKFEAFILCLAVLGTIWPYNFASNSKSRSCVLAHAEGVSIEEESLNNARSWNSHPYFDMAPLGDDSNGKGAWGSYRPGVYFGMKQIGTASALSSTSSPSDPNSTKSSALGASPVTGILWGTSKEHHR